MTPDDFDALEDGDSISNKSRSWLVTVRINPARPGFSPHKEIGILEKNKMLWFHRGSDWILNPYVSAVLRPVAAVPKIKGFKRIAR
jgi:hypothetical protein